MNSAHNCANCGQPQKRIAGEKTSAYRRRRYCSDRCRNAVRSQARTPEPPARTCLGCGTQFTRRAGEYKSKFITRTYCTPQCYFDKVQRDTTAKINQKQPCGTCGETITRRVGEDPRNFVKRKYCSPKCRMAGAGVRAPLDRHYHIPGQVLVTLIDACSDKNALELLDEALGRKKIDALINARDETVPALR